MVLLGIVYVRYLRRNRSFAVIDAPAPPAALDQGASDAFEDVLEQEDDDFL